MKTMYVFYSMKLHTIEVSASTTDSRETSICVCMCERAVQNRVIL